MWQRSDAWVHRGRWGTRASLWWRIVTASWRIVTLSPRRREEATIEMTFSAAEEEHWRWAARTQLPADNRKTFFKSLSEIFKSGDIFRTLSTMSKVNWYENNYLLLDTYVYIFRIIYLFILFFIQIHIIFNPSTPFHKIHHFQCHSFPHMLRRDWAQVMNWLAACPVSGSPWLTC